MSTSIKEYTSSHPDIPLLSTDLLTYLFSNPNKVPSSKPIFIDALTGSSYSYASVINLTKCLASGLRSLGVRPNDVVALSSPNTIDYPIQCYAIIGVGATVSPVNFASTSSDDAGLAASPRTTPVVWERTRPSRSSTFT